MNIRIKIFTKIGLLCFLFNPISAVNSKPGPDIKLVVQITVDGLRGDLIKRYYNAFGEGGFRFLMQQGVVYSQAFYQHANTETIVGHTTLATGAFPSQHGMIGNVWFDSQTKQLAYNVEAPEYPLLPARNQENEAEQVDPAQTKSRTQGRSPEAILVPTFSDALFAFYSGKSKVFGISGKDRSAISMAGHVGKAFWYSTQTGDFITSRYYYAKYPGWVKDWNSKRHAEDFAGLSWQLQKHKHYRLAKQDDRAYEVDLKGYGKVFPHPYGAVADSLYFTRLMVSPVGDQLTLDFAKNLIDHEQLGQDSIPDYLSISFSGVDAVNHFFGPSSLENEAVVLALDTTLADLLRFLEQRVGLQHTLIVLSADHGMAEMPEYMTELGYPAQRLDPDQLIAVANRVGKTYGIDTVVRFFYRPYLYLNTEKITTAKIELKTIEHAIALALNELNGVALAVTSDALDKNYSNPVYKQIRNNHHSSRSGNIYLVQEPYWFLFEKSAIAAMHGSPYRYDTHVPIIFMGPEIIPQKIYRTVHPVDVVPTLSELLNITPPALSSGTVLKEIFE